MFHYINLKQIKKRLKWIFWLIFIIYSYYSYYILFLGRYRLPDSQENYNIIQFKTINMYIEYYDHFEFLIWFLNLFGNVLLFIPLGFLAPLLIKRLNGIMKILILTFLLTFQVETFQLLFHVGEFDVDDIMLNTIGGLLGYLLLLIPKNLIIRLNKDTTKFTDFR
ncbi:hypothetical protein J6TS2_06440 [Heyndrickxia sporothermodurans]|nr:hypothetical protein J6TS2_06440 [Heyndrickxia sporothermodurans]